VLSSPSSRSALDPEVTSAAGLAGAPPQTNAQVSLVRAPSGRTERRVALAVVTLSALAFVSAVPFARTPLIQIPGFIASYEAALAICDLITAILLFGQFSRFRSLAVLMLASGYLFETLIIIPHALTFPGAFSPTGFLGAREQTTAWLYVFWHAGFPLFACAYALLVGRTWDRIPLDARAAVVAAILCVLVTVSALAVLATVGHDLLPVVVQNGDFSLMVTTGASPAIWVITLIALVALWRRRATTVLDLWLAVVLCAWLFDVALSAIVGSSRYDLGWYAGRTYGLLAASFVLAALLLEISELHDRLARTKFQLESHAKTLEMHVRETTTELGEVGMTVFSRARPELVVTDLLMPDKDGIETIREIRVVRSGGEAGRHFRRVDGFGPVPRLRARIWRGHDADEAISSGGAARRHPAPPWLFLHLT
jgi:hypothetical protein